MELNDLDGIRTSLKEIGADPSLLDDALGDRATWEAVVREHEELVDRTGAFGVPSPRQFPFNTASARPDGRPSPADVVQIERTIGMFGAHAPADAAVTALGKLAANR